MITVSAKHAEQTRSAGQPPLQTVREQQYKSSDFASVYGNMDATRAKIQTTITGWTADMPYSQMRKEAQALMTGDLEQDTEIFAAALTFVKTPEQLHAFVDAMTTGPDNNLRETLQSLVEGARKGIPALHDELERLKAAKEALQAQEPSSPEMAEARDKAIQEIDREIAQIQEAIKEKLQRSFYGGSQLEDHTSAVVQASLAQTAAENLL